MLEQSWRPGGASPAEIEALHVLRDAPRLDAIRAASVELYGHAQAPPADAIVYFDGVDESVGKIIKYATVETP